MYEYRFFIFTIALNFVKTINNLWLNKYIPISLKTNNLCFMCCLPHYSINGSVSLIFFHFPLHKQLLFVFIFCMLENKLKNPLPRYIKTEIYTSRTVVDKKTKRE